MPDSMTNGGAPPAPGSGLPPDRQSASPFASSPSLQVTGNFARPAASPTPAPAPALLQPGVPTQASPRTMQGVMPPATPQNGMPGPSPVAIPPAFPPPPDQPKKGSPIMVIVMVVVVLTLLGGGAYLAFRMGVFGPAPASQSSSSPSATTEPSAAPSVTAAPAAVLTPDEQRKADLETIGIALDKFASENAGAVPTAAQGIQLNAQASVISQALVPRYLVQLPLDPDPAKAYTYASPDGKKYTLGAVVDNVSEPTAQKYGDQFYIIRTGPQPVTNQSTQAAPSPTESDTTTDTVPSASSTATTNL